MKVTITIDQWDYRRYTNLICNNFPHGFPFSGITSLQSKVLSTTKVSTLLTVVFEFPLGRAQGLYLKLMVLLRSKNRTSHMAGMYSAS